MDLLRLAGIMLFCCVFNTAGNMWTPRAVNCSLYKDDYELSQNLSFEVRLNTNFVRNKSWAKMNQARKLTEMSILNIHCIPAKLACFPHLRKLILRNSTFCDPLGRPLFDLKYLPTSLIELEIKDIDLKYFSQNIERLKHLQILRFWNVSFNYLPNAVGHLPNLMSLSIINSGLTSLFKYPISLPSLKQITLMDNRRLSSLDFINGHPGLQMLFVSNCSIHTMPTDLPNLNNLNIIAGSLTNLAGIDTLGSRSEHPKHFHFDQNQITSIPPFIRNVRNLTWLNLNGNKLDHLPDDIYEIKTLTRIFLKNNSFSPSRAVHISREFSRRNPSVNVTM